MYPESLKSFLLQLEKHSQLHRITTEVDANLEISSVVDRVCKDKSPNKALLFEQVKGSSLHVAANLFGSDARMQIAMGADISQLADKVTRDLSKAKSLSSSAALRRIVEEHKLQKEICSDPQWQTIDATTEGLENLPALKSWPGDGGYYLTMGVVFSKLPDGEAQNCGIYRVQLVDNHTALIRCHPGSGGAQHIEAWHSRGLAMPVAIALGGPPALTWAAGVPLPENLSEPDYVQYLTAQQIPMSACCSVPLNVPANSEIVIEGEIFPGENAQEGPFGNHTGEYSAPTKAPVIRIKSVRMTENAVYPCTVVGPPPNENVYMAAAAQKLLVPLLKHDNPWVGSVHMPLEGIYHRAALVSLDRNIDAGIAEIQQALTSSLLLRNSRLLILMDEGAALDDLRQAYWHIVNTMICHRFEAGIVVDARRSQDSTRVKQNSDVLALVDERWAVYGFQQNNPSGNQ